MSFPLGPRMKIVHVLCHEEKFARLLREFHDRFMRRIRLRVADAPSPLAIPVPNQSWILRECFRRGQLCRIKIAPVTVLAAKRRDSAFSRNASACQNKNPAVVHRWYMCRIRRSSTIGGRHAGAAGRDDESAGKAEPISAESVTSLGSTYGGTHSANALLRIMRLGRFE